jgi:hypothetical protein
MKRPNWLLYNSADLKFHSKHVFALQGVLLQQIICLFKTTLTVTLWAYNSGHIYNLNSAKLQNLLSSLNTTARARAHKGIPSLLLFGSNFIWFCAASYGHFLTASNTERETYGIGRGENAVERISRGLAGKTDRNQEETSISIYDLQAENRTRGSWVWNRSVTHWIATWSNTNWSAGNSLWGDCEHAHDFKMSTKVIFDH